MDHKNPVSGIGGGVFISNSVFMNILALVSINILFLN